MVNRMHLQVWARKNVKRDTNTFLNPESLRFTDPGDIPHQHEAAIRRVASQHSTSVPYSTVVTGAILSGMDADLWNQIRLPSFQGRPLTFSRGIVEFASVFFQLNAAMCQITARRSTGTESDRKRLACRLISNFFLELVSGARTPLPLRNFHRIKI